MRPARIALISGISLLSLAALTAAALWLWRWRDTLPAGAARRLDRIFAERHSVADADNAYLFYMGFSAPESVDPLKLARQRIAWSRDRSERGKAAGADPGLAEAKVSKVRTAELERVVAACRDRGTRACLDAVSAITDVTVLTPREALLAERYDAARQRTGSYQPSPLDANEPLPAFEGAFEAQRIGLIRLRSVAQRGDAARVRAALQKDLAHWRMMLRESDILVTKMLAVAAIRAHFLYGNFVLRELPPERVAEAIPDAWRQPFTTDELSMWRVLAGELEYARSASSQVDLELDEVVVESGDGSMVGNLINRMRTQGARREQTNLLAQAYLDVAETFSVPLDRYLAARKAWLSNNTYDGDDNGLAEYVLRTGSTEGMRRAALITNQLRGRGVPRERVAEELRVSGPKNPYNHEPLRWDEKEQAIAFDGPERSRGLQTYVY